MLDVDFYKESQVFFTLVGNQFILGDGTSGHLSELKEVVEDHVDQMYPHTIINWKPIEAFMKKNKDKYGDNEDWRQVAVDLPDDIWSAMAITSAAVKHEGAGRWLAKSVLEEVREAVARGGQELERLIDDRSDRVRCAVAEQGYGLEELVRDFSPAVRHTVAKQGYGLDVLCKDKITSVRCEVVKQGYKLDLMILDKSPHVRAEVARQGYGLDALEKETSPIVKRGVKDYYKSLAN